MADIPKERGSYHLTRGPVPLKITPREKDPGTLQAYQWTSSKSGLKVVWIDIEGPLVNGYTAIATEIFNDSGCPHTLEHLIFLGSEQYPYKGVLDSLANRCFANGTNAWTAQHSTVYTVTTAGEEGFKTMLPVYLDHVLYPTITDSGFTTEVYHLSGEGEDGGVVFSEMQGRENDSSSLMSLRVSRTLYPQTSGYRSETGGLMDSLRVLTADTIRKYHAGTYLPHNIALIVTGKIDPASLLDTLEEKVEPRIEKHGQQRGEVPEGWTRPWVETGSKEKPDLKEDRTENVDFPESDETVGEMEIDWVGPEITDSQTNTAIDILNTYLSDSAVSPLYREFVEIEEPFCVGLGFTEYEHSTKVLQFYAYSVPVEHLATLGGKVKAALKRVAEEGIDMERMKMVLDRERLKVVSEVERNAADAISNSVINDFLFGSRDGKDLENDFREDKSYAALASWSADDWAKLLKKWYIDNPSLTVNGKPSAKLAKTLSAETKKRVEDNKKRLGLDGLKKLADDLKKAQEENDKEIPSEMLRQFPIPKIEGIQWIKVDTARPGKGKVEENEVQKHVERDGTKLPFFVQFDHVKSNFVTLTLHLNTIRLEPRLRRYLPLYLETFFALPVKRADGSELGYEDVVKQLDQNTVDYDIGVERTVAEVIAVELKVETSKYSTAISWLRDLVWGSKFDVERLKVVANRLRQNVPSEKREGNTVASATAYGLVLDSDKSTAAALNLFKKADFLNEVVEELKSDSEKVVKELGEFRQTLCSASAIRVSVAGDILALEKPVAAWEENFTKLKEEPLEPIVFQNQLLSDLGKKPAKKAVIVSMASIESTFALHAAPGPVGWDHPDRPALLVATTVLNAMESYLWKYIRGAGLAYGASISANPEQGLIYFRLYRSPDSSKAFAEGRKVVTKLAKGEINLDDVTLESAKSSLVYKLTSGVATAASAAEVSFANQVMFGVDKNNAKKLLAKAQDVTKQEVLDILTKYVLPVFEPSSSVAAIASAKTKVDDISAALTAEGFEVEKKALSGEAEDSDEEGDDEEDDEGESGDDDDEEEDEDEK